MPKVKFVENKIRRIEGFEVKIRHRDGKDVRSDMEGLPTYDFERAANSAISVSDWIDSRFNPYFAGFNIEVVYPNGEKVHGATKLGNVRESYG